MNVEKQYNKNEMIVNVDKMSQNNEIFSKIIDHFPYPMQIFDRKGTSVFVNKALLEMHNIPDASMFVGIFNLFNDPLLIKYGITDKIQQLFNGEKIIIKDVKFPLEDITKRYGIEPWDSVAVYHDIVAFPIFDDDNKVIYAASMLIERKIYKGKAEIIKGKEYIEMNWEQPFNLNKISFNSGFSKAHFARLFKHHTGYTQHSYYMKIKVEKIKEKLSDMTLSISEVFSSCGIDYNGHYVKMFKKHLGITPSEYRKIFIDTYTK